jgi:hypothetical protein
MGTDENMGARDDPLAAPEADRLGEPSGARNHPQSLAERYRVEEGARDNSVRALSAIQGPVHAGGSVAAEELLRAMGRLMDSLSTERARGNAAEERDRNAEIDNARLRAELDAERSRRRRVERELKDLRSEIEERRARARADVDRLTQDLRSEIEERRARAHADVDHLTQDLRRRRLQDQDQEHSNVRSDTRAQEQQRIAPVSDWHPGVDMITAVREADERSEAATGRPWRGEDASFAPMPTPMRENAAGRSDRRPPPPQLDVPPLPAGWRYASELPPRSHRRWWRRRAR